MSPVSSDPEDRNPERKANASMEPSTALRVLYIVDADAARDGDRLDAVLGAGVKAVWLRVPGAEGSVLYRLARELKGRLDAHGTALIVGGRADVALAVGAHGVQIGHRSPPARHIRTFFPGWMGVSCHGETDLHRAVAAGADYVVLSPVYGVPAKGPPLGTERFRQLAETVDIPVIGLGGIDAGNAANVRAAGAYGIAVIRALRDAPDPAAMATQLSAGNTPA